MLKYYKTINGKIAELPALEDGCWISLTAPTEDELCELERGVGVDHDYIRAALDEEEASRLESEEGQTLIVLDFPVMERADVKRRAQDTQVNYYTMPMGIIVTPLHVITVSLTYNPVTDDFVRNGVRNAPGGLNTQFKTQFVFLLLLRVASLYLQYLKQIDKLSERVLARLHSSMRNEELIQLMGLEKSLVYFSTSLKSIEKVLERLLRKKPLRFYDEDQDLLEDVLIEVKQAIEMSDIYSSILSGTMDAFASIISNNLNIVMKVLTVITIVLAVPTIVFSFYGMNVAHLPFDGTPWVSLGISLVFALIAAVLLTKMKLYR